MQALAGAYLTPFLHQDNLDVLIVRRLSTLFPSEAVEFEFADLARLSVSVGLLKPYFAFSVLKTYLSA